MSEQDALNKAINDRQDAEELLGQMSERLHEMQTTVEVQAEALEKSDRQLMDFIGKLNQIIGGEVANEEGAIARMEQLRRKADRLDAVAKVLDGNYSPDEAFRRDLACALRRKDADHAGLLLRAAELADVEQKNAELFRQLVEAKQDDGK